MPSYVAKRLNGRGLGSLRAHENRTRHHVDVATRSDLTREITVVDQLGVTQKPTNLEVCWEIDMD
jgi:inosine-uridine nucleoside N-ribohydrolase